MGSSKEDVRRVSIYINGDEADLTLGQLTRGTAKLKNELSQLTLGTEEYRQKMHQLADSRAVLADVKHDIDKLTDSLTESKKHAHGLGEALENIKEGLEVLGIGLAIGELVSFGKELFELQVKASGIHNAFAKIGETEGFIEKLREASRGLIGDLDLEKIATKANNANIPLNKMGQFLQFAQQRARDTGEDVTVLTEKLIEGLGKNTPKALAGLGISIKEVKEDFKRTGDMVETVSNIISRQMAEAGTDVDDFGDKVISLRTKIENIKDSMGMAIQKTFFKELADPEAIAKRTTKELEEWEGYKEFSKKQLDEAIKIQQARMAARKIAKNEAEKQFVDEGGNPFTSNIFHTLTKGSASTATTAQYKYEQEAYQGALNALLALKKEKEKGTVADQVDDDGNEKRQRAAEAAAKRAEAEKKAQQEYLAQSAVLDAKLKEFNASELADTLSKNDKEVEALKNKYDREWTEATAALTKLRQSKNANEEQIQKQQDQIDKLAGQKTAAVNLLREKQEKDITEKIKALRAHLSDKIVAETQREIDEINEKFDALSKDAGNDPIAQAQIDAGRQAAINDAKLNEASHFAKEMERIQAEANVDDSPAGKKTRLAEVDKKYAAELAALKANYTLEFQATVAFHDAVDKLDKNRSAAKKKIEDADRKSYQQKAIDTAENISNIVFSNERDAREEEMNSQLKGLETEKNAQLSAKNLTAKQKADIEAKFAAQEADIKRKNWEANKMAMAEQALMNGALGLIKLWVDPGFPAAIPLAIGLGAEVAVQEAAILSQKTPAFAEGGYSAVDYTNPSGWVRRPTLFANSSSGRPFIAGEGNKSEYIVSSQQLRDPVVANFVGMMESNRTVKHFESGGYSSTGGSNSSSSSAAATQTSDRLDRIEAALEKQAAINEIPVTFNTRAHDLYVARITQITNKATT